MHGVENVKNDCSNIFEQLDSSRCLIKGSSERLGLLAAPDPGISDVINPSKVGLCLYVLGIVSINLYIVFLFQHGTLFVELISISLFLETYECGFSF